MKKNNELIAILATLLLLNACTTVGEGLAGTKKKGNEEFLVEKKAPLILPPSFGELPEPGEKIDENTSLNKKDTSSLEKIIKQSSSTDSNKKNNDLNISIEKAIIEKINE